MTVATPAWLTFERDSTWFPRTYGRAVHVAYRAGTTAFVPRECAMLMLERGNARPATETEIVEARRARRPVA